MTLTYSIPVQTVTLEWTVDEQVALTEAGVKSLKDLFVNLVGDLKGKIEEVKTKVGG